MVSKPTEEEAFHIVESAIRQVLRLPPSHQITRETILYKGELGIDSVNAMRLILELEAGFDDGNVRISPEVAVSCIYQTVGGVVNYVLDNWAGDQASD